MPYDYVGYSFGHIAMIVRNVKKNGVVSWQLRNEDDHVGIIHYYHWVVSVGVGVIDTYSSGVGLPLG